MTLRPACFPCHQSVAKGAPTTPHSPHGRRRAVLHRAAHEGKYRDDVAGRFSDDACVIRRSHRLRKHFVEHAHRRLNEFMAFPIRNRVAGRRAIRRLFRAFKFLDASGNLSDLHRQPTPAFSNGKTVDDVLMDVRRESRLRDQDRRQPQDQAHLGDDCGGGCAEDRRRYRAATRPVMRHSASSPVGRENSDGNTAPSVRWSRSR